MADVQRAICSRLVANLVDQWSKDTGTTRNQSSDYFSVDGSSGEDGHRIKSALVEVALTSMGKGSAVLSVEELLSLVDTVGYEHLAEEGRRLREEEGAAGE